MSDRVRLRFSVSLLEFGVAGPSAWFIGEPGQVGNEAAIAVPNQCRSQARHPCS